MSDALKRDPFDQSFLNDDQIGYRIVAENGVQQLRPVNVKRQAVFEAALRQLRPKSKEP